MSAAVLAFPTGEELGPYASLPHPGARCFHPKFGIGTIAEVDGNKLTVDFDAAGRKRVVDSFCRVWLTAGAR